MRVRNHHSISVLVLAPGLRVLVRNQLYEGGEGGGVQRGLLLGNGGREGGGSREGGEGGGGPELVHARNHESEEAEAPRT